MPELHRSEPMDIRLREAATAGTLSHALIFSGVGDRLAAARFAAAALECESDSHRPCGLCEGCRKVAADIHPDVVTVHDSDHKTLPVETVRAVRADAYIRPNEGNRKIYLFDDCTQLDEKGQDILLKIVEEGPPYAAFLFCAENSAALRPTLRSRCVEYRLRPADETAEDSPLAEELCACLAAKKLPELVAFLTARENSKLTREELGALLACTRERVAAALQVQCAVRQPETATVAALAEKLTKTQLIRTLAVLETYGTECEWNVGVGHVLGALAVEWEGIL
ncbi:MAG: DNA polymerase III subunit delta' [Oscillospiraceae bacterium]